MPPIFKKRNFNKNFLAVPYVLYSMKQLACLTIILLCTVHFLSGCGQTLNETMDTVSRITNSSPSVPVTSPTPTSSQTTTTAPTIAIASLPVTPDGIFAEVPDYTTLKTLWPYHSDPVRGTYQVRYKLPGTTDFVEGTINGESRGYTSYQYLSLGQPHFGTYEVIVSAIATDNKTIISAPTYSFEVVETIVTHSSEHSTTCGGSRYDSNWAYPTITVPYDQDVTIICSSAPYVTNVTVKLDGELLLNYNSNTNLSNETYTKTLTAGTHTYAINGIPYPPPAPDTGTQYGGTMSYRAQQILYGRDKGHIFMNTLIKTYGIKKNRTP